MHQRRWNELFSDYECEICYHPGKANVVADALSRKERVKPKCVPAMAIIIHYRVKRMILVAHSEAFKQENVPAERLHSLDQHMERKEDKSLYFMDRIWVLLVRGVRTIIMNEPHKTRYSVHPGADKMYHVLRDMYWWRGMKRDIATSRWMVYITFLAHIIESLRDAIGYEYGLSSSYGWTNYHSSIRCAPFEALYGRKCWSPVLWAEIRESRLIGPEFIQKTTDKVVLIREKLKAMRDCQKSYANNRFKPLEFKVVDRVLLKMSPWKGVIRFGKKDILAPRYVGPFEILERIGPVAYRLRLLEELSSVHDTFHVSNLNNCLADANLHVPLDEIKIDKTLCFLEERIEIIDREVKSLKRSKITIVKIAWP
nr:putative reverse transcriptase domain-containing protein [Tanacetum cinerariifolium]